MITKLINLQNLPKLLSSSFSSIKIYNKQQCMDVISKTTAKIQKVAQITLGPYGRNVLIQSQMQGLRITKDGVTVVKHIQFENRMQDAVARLVKKSVDGTNKFAGDGTTTSTVLIGEIMRIAYRKIATGSNVRDIRKGFQIGRKISLEFLQSCARKITKKQQLMNVAMISTNGKTDIATLVVEAVYNCKTVRVQKSQKQQNYLQYHSGFSLPRGFESKQYANAKLDKLQFNYPMVVTSLLPINQVKQVIKSLELAKKARKQVIFFAPFCSQSVKSTLIYNKLKKIVQCCSISFPYGGKSQQFIKKVADNTQSYLFTQFSQHKIQNIDWEHFGKAVKIQSDYFETKIQINDKNSNKSVQAIIMVGGSTQTVMLENYDHIIDALNSTKSAMRDGVVAGGGVTLWRLSQLLQTYQGQGQVGVKILAEALKQPRKKLMQYIPPQNKPLSGQLWQGYDLKQQKIVDMFQAGIMDSVNVVKSTIIDSLSLCTVLVEVQIGLGRIDKNISQISLKQLNDRHKL